MATLRERFSNKWRLNSNGCHDWTSVVNQGRGRISYLRKKIRASHVSWFLSTGDWPNDLGLQVLHHCDRPICVNFDHLFLGTQADNVSDMVAKGRNRAPIKTECKRGHPLSGDNLYEKKGGQRQCKECVRISNDKNKHKRKAKQAQSAQLAITRSTIQDQEKLSKHP